ncbi:hypothetical protein CLV78_101986 [Aliiruegeria haliotis]|uniref:DUF4261 domain-containing protein n=1 Tax=Aliiruegeria haliotis TaxID=1280846 RepID=A0A2T0S0I7_9RHOB|nr:hypothetical protein [Aliiruegeria haliotis]PRY26882.1 hypothetical protein CLV78_101986 [Aliiruegeria haliotis]
MPLSNQVSATLLLPRPATFTAERLLERVNDGLSGAGVHFRLRETPRGILLTSDTIHVQVMARDLPVQDRRFEAALTSDLPRLLGEDWAELVAEHRASVKICAGPGPRPGETPGTGPELGKQDRQDLADLMMLACHEVAVRMAETCPPLAVHWNQSQQILTPERFAAVANMRFPLPLFLHGRPTETGPGGLGLRIVGAEALVGHALEISPVARPHDWLMSRVLAFVSFLRARGHVPADGSAFGVEDGERIVVRRTDGGGIRLVVEAHGGKSVKSPTHRVATDQAA